MNDTGKQRVSKIKRYRSRDCFVHEGNLALNRTRRARNKRSQDHRTEIGATSLRAKASRGEKLTIHMYVSMYVVSIRASIVCIELVYICVYICVPSVVTTWGLRFICKGQKGEEASLRKDGTW